MYLYIKKNPNISWGGGGGFFFIYKNIIISIRMINVISFCLYGSRATYVLGMKENILLGKKYYPDWEIRIYHNDTVPEQYIKEYGEMGAKCILCKNLGKI